MGGSGGSGGGFFFPPGQGTGGQAGAGSQGQGAGGQGSASGTSSGGAGAGGEPGNTLPPTLSLPFAASNLPADLQGQALPSTEFLLTKQYAGKHQHKCTVYVNTDTGEVHDAPKSVPLYTFSYTFKIATQKGGRELGVFLVQSLQIESGCGLRAIGSRPLVIVAAGDVTIDGYLDIAYRDPVTGYAELPAGAHVSVNDAGPGAGKASPQANFGTGGGASHCTPGGKGGGTTAGGAGKVYGTSTLTPLLGGSVGGHAALEANNGGQGGGAVQISAGGALELGPSGTIQLSGGGGGNATASYGHGGGSGGALLLEATTISVKGKIAANGGSGSGFDEGSVGELSDQPVGSAEQGHGAAGDKPATGGLSGGGYSGGGGGGSGRIRFNTLSGKAEVTLSSVVSPYASTGCVSDGTLPDKVSSSAGAFQKPAVSCDAFTSQATCPSCLEASCCEELAECLASDECKQCIVNGFDGCTAGAKVSACGQQKCGADCPP